MDEKIKILYAEDTLSWALMVEQILAPRGFEVRMAGNGEEALKMFGSYSPDLVLLDIDMPGRNGWELVREFKKEREEIPVVLYSTYYDAAKISEAFGLGAEDFLSKTTGPEELAERLRAYHVRAVAKREKTEVFRISERVVFYPLTGVLIVGEGKEILKHNEARLLHLLCLQINQEANKKYLCEGIWGESMYNEVKCKALKIYITNLRKYLSGDPSLLITNKRWGGYCLIDHSEK